MINLNICPSTLKKGSVLIVRLRSNRFLTETKFLTFFRAQALKMEALRIR